MERNTFLVLLVVFTAWFIAVLLKALRVLRAGEPYVFAMWDGGMMNRGKQLSALGTRIKVALTLCILVGCILTVTGALPPQTGRIVVIGTAVLGLVADVSLTEKPR